MVAPRQHPQEAMQKGFFALSPSSADAVAGHALMPSEDLDLLQRQFPDCTTLAFADIGAGMVLVTNSDAALEQHALNRLCAEAAATLAAQGGLSPQAAMICAADEIRVILRADKHPDDVLICICSPSLDLPAFRAAAQATLGRLAAAD